MPAIRLSTRRRRSSHAIFTPAKPGVYGVVQPRPVTFAPNVTPITYVETDDDDLLSSPQSPPSPLSSQHTTLFPPSSTPAPPPTRKRCPPGKRRSQGYIPRPPNAFMLFRADFVRQKHVPGSIETNHGSLSKIIGNCWRQLPLDEKRIWEIRAKQEKANHKAQFPDYRFRPVHNKNKNKLKFSTTTSSTNPTTSSSSTNNPDGTTYEEEERRCEQVAQLLLEGMKGEDLARAVKDLDRVREEAASTSRTQPTTPSFDDGSLAMPIPMPSFNNPFAFSEYGFGNSDLALPPSAAAYHRRSSSVPLPLPNGSDFYLPSFGEYPTAAPQALDISAIALPSVPFMSHSQSQTRSSSPVNNISRQHQQRTLLGHRRASSAQPVIRRSWAMPFYPNSNPNTFSNGTAFNNADMSGFDWSSMNMGNIQVERDESPLPEVDLELFNGFSFDEGVSCVDASSTSAVNTLSSSSSSSSVSDRSSPWLDTPTHSHTRIHPHRPPPAIAPHDLPPLDVSSDMNWRGPSTTTSAQSQPQTLLSASSTTSSSSPAFTSPSLSAPDSTIPTEKRANSTQGIFDLGGLGIDFGLGGGMDMNGMGGGGVEYGYDMSMGFSDMGLGYNHHHTAAEAVGGGNEIGMVIPASEMDTMWGVSQAQQA